MLPRLYTDLAPWWPLLSPPEAYAEEARVYHALIAQALGRPPESLLELGCGGGTLASHLPPGLELVLNDLSPEMLAVAQARNPDHRTHQGDLRSLRLGRRFDAVLLHDAVMYMLDEDDLRAAFETARAHLAPGGAFLVVPDLVKDDFFEGTDAGGDDAPDGRGARLLEWRWDPDPDDTTFRVDMALLLRDEEGRVRSIHEQHRMGIFPRARWWALLAAAGFAPRAADLLAVGPEAPLGEVFLSVAR